MVQGLAKLRFHFGGLEVHLPPDAAGEALKQDFRFLGDVLTHAQSHILDALCFHVVKINYVAAPPVFFPRVTPLGDGLPFTLVIIDQRRPKNRDLTDYVSDERD